MFGIDVNYLQVKVAEGALLPTVTLQADGAASLRADLSVNRPFSAAANAQLSVPIYQGGAEYSLIRQSKESLAQQRLVLEQTRDQARANVVTAWGQLVAGKAQVASAQAQVHGVRNRLERRARGSQGRTAHHARRAERAAGAGQRPQRAGHRAARPRRRVLLTC